MHNPGAFGRVQRRFDGSSWESRSLFTPSFEVSSGNLGMQSFQAMRPQGTVVIEPVVQLRQRLRTQAVNPELRLLAHLDQPSVPQNPKVSRGTRPGDWKQRGQFACGSRTVTQSFEDRSPSGVRKCLQHGIHGVVFNTMGT
jgi:hypothetical protein